MPTDADICYRALSARDRRFDGLFFVGVTTTGIYCRPICPARRPARKRCEFFTHAAEAERAGFRACFRCRPELAPGDAAVDATGRLVALATRHIEAGYLNDHSVDELAETLAVSARHLRRTMEAELGVSAIELAQTRRLSLAKQLLHDTTLPLTQVALAAGFGSVRRFNASFRQRFDRRPSEMRRSAKRHQTPGCICVRLDYRPPLDWPAMLEFFAARAIPGVERVADGSYQRVAAVDGLVGLICVRADASAARLWADVSLSLAPQLPYIVSRLRAMFDVDARPDVIAQHVPTTNPGLRVPGAFDNFELAVRAIVGQQISVRGATTLAGRFAYEFGAAMPADSNDEWTVFPSAAQVATLPVANVRAIGLPQKRAQTIIDLAQALASGKVDLTRGGDPEVAIAQLQQVRGIGPWTANYIVMRTMKWPDAFLAEDLIVRRHLQTKTAGAARAHAATWRPWRAYAVMQIWAKASAG